MIPQPNIGGMNFDLVMLPQEPKRKSKFNFGYNGEICMAERGSVKREKDMLGKKLKVVSVNKLRSRLFFLLVFNYLEKNWILQLIKLSQTENTHWL